MANYYCRIRTNYFHVKDPEGFRVFMGGVHGTGDGVELWEEKGDAGELVFGFGTLGDISGWYDPNNKSDEAEDDDVAYDTFINGLQDHVAADDAVIILESGYEKLNYIVCRALIVTSNATEYIDLGGIACKKAAEMLGSPTWTTKCDY